MFTRPLEMNPRPSVVIDGDAVHAERVGNQADDLAGIDVDDFDAIAVRDVRAARRGVDGDVVPSAGPADGDVPRDMPGGEGGGGDGEREESDERAFHGGERYRRRRSRAMKFVVQAAFNNFSPDRSRVTACCGINPVVIATTIRSSRM